jgi:hypothetical protein
MNDAMASCRGDSTMSGDMEVIGRVVSCEDSGVTATTTPRTVRGPNGTHTS